MKTIIIVLTTLCLTSTIYAQQWKWAVQTKVTGPDTLSSIFIPQSAIDHNGNVYVTANINLNNYDTLKFGIIKTPYERDSSVVLIKLDSNGLPKWIKKNYSNYDPRYFDNKIVVDKYNNVWVSGQWLCGTSLLDTLSFGAHSFLFQNTEYQNFIVKYDSNGNDLAALTINGFDDSGRTGYIGTDNSGNLYFSGTFDKDTAIVANDTMYNSVVGSHGWDTYLIKLDNSGNIQWLRKGIGASNEYPMAFTVDAIGNSYIAGKFSSPTLAFGSTTLSSPDNWFLVKYDASGSVAWAHSYNLPSGGYIDNLTVNNRNDLYLSGRYNANMIMGSDTLIFYYPPGHTVSDQYLARCNASTGNIIWAKNYGDTWYIPIQTITVDASGNPWVYGGFNTDGIKVGIDTLIYSSNSKGDYASFLAQFDTSGNVQCFTVLPVSGTEAFGGGGIFADDKGYLYLASSINMFVGNRIAIGKDTLTKSYTRDDLLIAKFQPCDMPVTNVEPINKVSDMLVYPNPAYDEFTICRKDNNQASIELYNISGQLIKTYSLTADKINISVASLLAGLYFVKYNEAGGVSIVKKLMVVK